MKNIFSNKNFRLLWIGQLATIFGNRFSEIALPWIILNQTGSPLKVGLVIICQHIGPMIFSIPVGNLIEKINKKKVLLFSDAIQFIITTLIIIFTLNDSLSISVISILMFVSGIANLFFRVSFNSMLPSIFGREKLVDVHNSIEAADAVSTLLGPILAGTSIALLGAVWTMSIDAFSFLLSFLSVLFITYNFKMFASKVDNDTRSPSKSISSKSEWILGIKYIFSNKIQVLLTFTQVTLYFLTVGVGFLTLILTKEVNELSAFEIGVIFSGAGVGNIVGVLIMNKVKKYSWKNLSITLFFVSAVGVLLVALSKEFIVATLGMFLYDGALSMIFVLYSTARQASTHDHLLARVSSAGVLISSSTILLSTTISSFIAEYYGPQNALWICIALLFITAVLYTRLAVPKLTISELKPEKSENEEELQSEIY
ncbi:MFS transporter [Exiguobacterium sp. RIT452]|uniref:MFS transporter n=1 Tax=Exiguobacterium sp. RIT452 TaxID=2315552 RepID=UPI000E75CDB0|nr:MFS transporter [Exiguobacterium sp. RIT452]RJO94822.1 MFS transporter [Exiguobacterium sp. RIT452]